MNEGDKTRGDPTAEFAKEPARQLPVKAVYDDGQSRNPAIMATPTSDWLTGRRRRLETMAIKPRSRKSAPYNGLI
jgi:hypothetical protein